LKKSEQIIPYTQIIWINEVDDKTKDEVLDILIEMLLEQRRRQVIALTGSNQDTKVAAAGRD